MPLNDERNPFDPDPEGPPLRLTFDSHSLSRLEGREAEEAEFLYSLCDAEEIDGLVTWAEPGFAPNVPAAVMGQERGHLDSVKVTMLGEVGGYIGGIPYIDQWREAAEGLHLTGRARERVIETGPRLAFHQSSKRHLFVCGDGTLLAQRGKSPYANLWKGVFSVRETLELVGGALRARGKVYEQVRGGYSSAITNYGVRFPPRGRRNPEPPADGEMDRRIRPQGFETAGDGLALGRASSAGNRTASRAGGGRARAKPLRSRQRHRG